MSKKKVSVASTPAPEAKKPIKFDALFDQVVIVRDEGESKTPTGIILAESAKKKTCSGVVVAVGPGRVTEAGTVVPPKIKLGWRVHFPEFGGQEVEIDGVTYIVLRETALLLVRTAE